MSYFEENGYENMEKKNRERTESKTRGQNQVLRLAESGKALVESVTGSSCDTVRKVDNQDFQMSELHYRISVVCWVVCKAIGFEWNMTVLC